MSEPTSAPRDGGLGGTSHPHANEGADGEAQQGPVVRDRRRLDPQTGKVRETYASAASGSDPGVSPSPRR